MKTFLKAILLTAISLPALAKSAPKEVNYYDCGNARAMLGQDEVNMGFFMFTDKGTTSITVSKGDKTINDDMIFIHDDVDSALISNKFMAIQLDDDKAYMCKKVEGFK